MSETPAKHSLNNNHPDGKAEDVLLAWFGNHPLYARKAASLDDREELIDYITYLLYDADKRLSGTPAGRSLLEVRSAIGGSLDGFDWDVLHAALSNSETEFHTPERS